MRHVPFKSNSKWDILGGNIETYVLNDKIIYSYVGVVGREDTVYITTSGGLSGVQVNLNSATIFFQ